MSPATWRHHRHPNPHGTTPPPVVRRYNPGWYTAIIQPGQIKNAIGKDTTGTFVDPDGITQNYLKCRIPGGHLGTCAYPGFVGGLNGTTDGPVTSGVRGLVVPYYWNDLEPTANNYDDGWIDADMNACILLGVQLIVMVTVRTFKNVASDNPAPGAVGTYLNQLPFNINYQLSGGGWEISRWLDVNKVGAVDGQTWNVQDRYRKLVQHITTRWGGHPNFEGIATQETACNMSDVEQQSTFYDKDDYFRCLKQEADIVKAADPNIRHFGYANYIPTNAYQANGAGNNQAYVDALVESYFLYMGTTGCSVSGGPDCLPDSVALQSRVYGHYDALHNTAPPNNGPIFIAWQDATFSQTVRTATQLFKWSTNQAIGAPALPAGGTVNLHADYIFENWELNNSPGFNFDPEARLVIAANPSGWNSYTP